MTTLAHVLHRTVHLMPSYVHTTFMWRAHEVLLAETHQRALNLLLNHL